MEAGEWTAIVACALALFGAVYSAVRFLVKSIMRELLPNGGNSMRDEIRTLTSRVDQIYIIVAQSKE
jgi:hypothetical protein